MVLHRARGVCALLAVCAVACTPKLWLAPTEEATYYRTTAAADTVFAWYQGDTSLVLAYVDSGRVYWAHANLAPGKQGLRVLWQPPSADTPNVLRPHLCYLPTDSLRRGDALELALTSLNDPVTQVPLYLSYFSVNGEQGDNAAGGVTQPDGHLQLSVGPKTWISQAGKVIDSTVFEIEINPDEVAINTGDPVRDSLAREQLRMHKRIVTYTYSQQDTFYAMPYRIRMEVQRFGRQFHVQLDTTRQRHQVTVYSADRLRAATPTDDFTTQPLEGTQRGWVLLLGPAKQPRRRYELYAQPGPRPWADSCR